MRAFSLFDFLSALRFDCVFDLCGHQCEFTGSDDWGIWRDCGRFRRISDSFSAGPGLDFDLVWLFCTDCGDSGYICFRFLVYYSAFEWPAVDWGEYYRRGGLVCAYWGGCGGGGGGFWG